MSHPSLCVLPRAACRRSLPLRRSRCRMGAKQRSSIMLVVIAILLAYSAATYSQETLRAFSDSRALPPLSTYETALQSLKTTLCARGVPGQRSPSENLTLAQALASIQRALDRSGQTGAFKSFVDSASKVDERTLVAWAASAAAARKPGVALAAFLAAHHLFPKNPRHLVNAAGILNVLDMPTESLALLDAADVLSADQGKPMGLDGRALALNNRGLALLASGQWAKAEALLREAITREPLLAEARSNLGIALLCQGNTAEGAKYFRSGQVRSPRTLSEEPQTDLPNPPLGGCDPAMPIESLFDLSAGVPANLPAIPDPAGVEEYSSFLHFYIDLRGRAGAQALQYASLQDTWKTKAEAQYRTSPPSPLTEKRVNDIWCAVLVSYQHDPETRTRRDIVDADLQDVVRIWPAVEVELEQLVYRNLDEPENSVACRQILESYHHRWLDTHRNLDRDTRALADHLHKRLTALAANFIDPNEHGQVIALADYDALVLFGETILRLRPSYLDRAASSWSSCEGGASSVAPSLAIPDLPHSEACPKALKATRVSCDILGVLELEANCEQVSVKVRLPLIGPIRTFEELNIKTGGELTMFAGLEVSIGTSAISVGSSGGIYIKGNSEEITDVGFKVEPFIQGGPLSCKADNLEVGVAATKLGGEILPDVFPVK